MLHSVAEKKDGKLKEIRFSGIPYFQLTQAPLFPSSDFQKHFPSFPLAFPDTKHRAKTQTKNSNHNEKMYRDRRGRESSESISPTLDPMGLGTGGTYPRLSSIHQKHQDPNHHSCPITVQQILTNFPDKLTEKKMKKKNGELPQKLRKRHHSPLNRDEENRIKELRKSQREMGRKKQREFNTRLYASFGQQVNRSRRIFHFTVLISSILFFFFHHTVKLMSNK